MSYPPGPDVDGPGTDNISYPESPAARDPDLDNFRPSSLQPYALKEHGGVNALFWSRKIFIVFLLTLLFVVSQPLGISLTVVYLGHKLDKIIYLLS